MFFSNVRVELAPQIASFLTENAFVLLEPSVTFAKVVNHLGRSLKHVVADSANPRGLVDDVREEVPAEVVFIFVLGIAEHALVPTRLAADELFGMAGVKSFDDFFGVTLRRLDGRLGSG